MLRHHRPTNFKTETAYNAALVQACIESKVEVAGVTDHYRIKESRELISALSNAGIRVFPGFEAVTEDGVHFLCLFDSDTPSDRIDRIIGACGIRDNGELSPLGEHDTQELLDQYHQWAAVCVAAHVAGDGGLLKKLQGQTGVAAWKNRNLLACSLPGPVLRAPEGLRPILENRNADYRR